VESYYKNNVKPADIENRSFQFIGSKNESEMLVLAQATHQLAAQYSWNEQVGVKHELLDNPLKIGNFKSLGPGYIDGFKASAAKSYLAASQVIKEKGFTQVADDIAEVAGSIEFDSKHARRHSPSRFAEVAEWLQDKLAQKDNNMYLDADSRKVRPVAVDDTWKKTMTVRARQSLGLVV